MAIMAPVWIPEGTSSGTVTNGDTYLPDGDAAFKTFGATEILLITVRESEVGTCTMQAFGEMLDVPSNTWIPWLDMAGAQIAGVEYANSEVDTSTPFHRFVSIHRAPIFADADGVVIVNTVHKAYQALIPPYIRFRFRHGGTSVSNVYHATLSAR